MEMEVQCLCTNLNALPALGQYLVINMGLSFRLLGFVVIRVQLENQCKLFGPWSFGFFGVRIPL